jgi:putative ABC transport system permease protein
VNPLRAIWSGRRIPLAWLLLTRQPVRLAVALAGISFAGILMFMQLGFRDALFDASVTVHKMFNTDLVLMSPRTKSSISMAGFPRRRLVQALADPAVQGISPVHWNLLLWRNPETRGTRSILALGFEPGDPLFHDPALTAKAALLTQKGRVLFDERSRNRVRSGGQLVPPGPHGRKRNLRQAAEGGWPVCGGTLLWCGWQLADQQ